MQFFQILSNMGTTKIFCEIMPLVIMHDFRAFQGRALVSTGATGAVAPELFEEHIGQKQIFCDISKVLLVKN